MILDERTEFADAVSVAAAAGTALIGDVVDLTLTSLDVGLGEEMWVIIQVDTAFVAAGAGTIQFFVVSDALATLGAGVLASCTQHLATALLVTAASTPAGQTAGSVLLAARLPAGTYERYLGILSTVATNTMNSGKINAFLTKDYAKWTALADASN